MSRINVQSESSLAQSSESSDSSSESFFFRPVLRPGFRFAVGASAEPVVLELTGWADPCSTIAGCFSDGRYERISHDRHPGTSRAYAAVLRPGRVSTGDPVVVLA